jgi:hypothetical protein
VAGFWFRLPQQSSRERAGLLLSMQAELLGLVRVGERRWRKSLGI